MYIFEIFLHRLVDDSLYYSTVRSKQQVIPDRDVYRGGLIDSWAPGPLFFEGFRVMSRGDL